MDNKTSSNLKNEQNNEENPQMLNHNGDNQASNHLDKDNSKTDKMKTSETLDGGNMGNTLAKYGDNMILTLLGENNEKNKTPNV